MRDHRSEGASVDRREPTLLPAIDLLLREIAEARISIAKLHSAVTRQGKPTRPTELESDLSELELLLDQLRSKLRS